MVAYRRKHGDTHGCKLVSALAKSSFEDDNPSLLESDLEGRVRRVRRRARAWSPGCSRTAGYGAGLGSAFDAASWEDPPRPAASS